MISEAHRKRAAKAVSCVSLALHRSAGRVALDSGSCFPHPPPPPNGQAPRGRGVLYGAHS
jgi:hypothetical protein